jgi:hypothetical protein
MAEDRKISDWVNAIPPIDTDGFPIVQRAQSPSNRLLSFAALKNGLGAAFIAKSNPVIGPSLPTYPDNATAIAGGLVVGAMYRTSTGQLMVTF